MKESWKRDLGILLLSLTVCAFIAGSMGWVLSRFHMRGAWGLLGVSSLVAAVGLWALLLWPMKLREAIGKATRDMQAVNRDLQRVIFERTEELQNANRLLRAEVAERHLAEEALRENQEQLLAMMRSAPDAIFIETNGTFAYVNEAAVRLYGGASEEELLARPIMDRFHPDCRPVISERLQSLRNGEKTAPIELIHVRLDGTAVSVEVNSVPVRYRGEDGTLAFVRDLTERKKAEQDTITARQRYRNMFQFMKSGVTIFMPDEDCGDFIIQDCNPAAEKISNVDRASIVGKRALDCFPMFAELGVIAALQRVCRAGEPERISHFYRDELREGWREGFLYRLPTGEVVCIYDDVTDRVRAEEERQMLESQLRQAQKLEAIGTLAGGIAHDFNNILSAIFGYTEMSIARSPEQSPVRRDLERILQAARRARDLVRQILGFSRMRPGQSRKPVRIGPVIREALAFLRALIPSTIEMKINIADDDSVVLADPTQIHQVITNLCTNAAQAMEESGGTLEVSLERTTVSPSSVAQLKELEQLDCLVLTVRDTGHGMDPATLQRIFDPYFTTKGQGKGTGLGLSVVHGIVRGHEGAITVNSTPGKGSVFQVYLPVVPGRAETGDVEALPLPGGNERILFLDDEEPLAQLGQEMLESLGYEVNVGTDSVEALERFRKDPGRFDLVITDYTMPKLTGADLAAEMMRIRPGIPVILCTGYTERISQEKAKELNIRALLLKPLDRRSLADSVRKALDVAK